MSAAASRKVAVIDIGSNSIRLVVYHDGSRAPLPLFNEKVLCGLGRGLTASGQLNEDGMKLALANLVRFRALIDEMAVPRLDVVATAAVREASNGAAFVAEAERRAGIKIRIISGLEEARLSALGVLSAFPDADGFMGDLGGGSLELVDIGKGEIGRNISVPLGALYLMDRCGDDRGAARGLIQRTLKDLPWLKALKGRRFYAVGGAWRAMARMMMEQRHYPLHIIHHYEVPTDAARSFLARVRRMERDELRKAPGLSRRRADTLPTAALILDQLLVLGDPSSLVFSAQGLREGVLFDHLSPAMRRRDPLLAACNALRGEARFDLDPQELFDFLAPLTDALPKAVRRLIKATCIVSDLAWMEHPDYRAEQAYRRVLRLPVVGIDHPGRAFMAAAIAIRYGAGRDELPDDVAAHLLDPALFQTAVEVGQALRLAFTLSGGAPHLLTRCQLLPSDGQLALVLDANDTTVIGDAVRRRLETLGKSRGLPVAMLRSD